MTLSLRPHHVLCSIGFEGSGYDAPFIANMTRIVVQTLRGPNGREQTIQITNSADAICAPCPKRRGLGCEEKSKIDVLDAAHAAALGLRPAQRLSWGECHDRAVTRVTPDDLDRICHGCSWLPLGMCKARLSTAIEAHAQKMEKAASEETALD